MTSVLIVEDEEALAALFQDLLTEEGYETYVAHDGRDALRQLAEVQPDVVLSDVMLPFVTGLELARAMAASPAHHTIPVILMTAAGQGMVMDGTPYAAFLAKPFDLSRLIATLERVLHPPP